MEPMENKDGQMESLTSSITSEIPSPSLEEDFAFWKKKIKEISDDYQQFKENIAQLMAAIDEKQKLADASKKQQEKLANKIKQIERNLSRQTKNNIELLGIFVTLFTFISVSASVALQIKNVYHASLFISVFCLCLFAFLHVFHNFIQANEPQRGVKKLCGICFLVFLVVIIMGGFCWKVERNRVLFIKTSTPALEMEKMVVPQSGIDAFNQKINKK